uniref:Uncharacterized protein n=1 Tax=Anguilla anguilla TaxID=7936 RepID=A0A0E9RV99_ANGAN
MKQAATVTNLKLSTPWSLLPFFISWLSRYNTLNVIKLQVEPTNQQPDDEMKERQQCY